MVITMEIDELIALLIHDKELYGSDVKVVVSKGGHYWEIDDTRTEKAVNAAQRLTVIILGSEY
jgi:hypothetical protein